MVSDHARGRFRAKSFGAAVTAAESEGCEPDCRRCSARWSDIRTPLARGFGCSPTIVEA